MDILSSLKRLSNITRLLYVAAHPDDENSRLLSWLSYELGIDCCYLSLTRGEGGQNLIGSELGTELGVIRSSETVMARGIDGAVQRFTSVVDFGYSKNPTDTFNHWDRDAVVGDVVWAIRSYRPHVIVLRFPPFEREELEDNLAFHNAGLVGGAHRLQPESSLALLWHGHHTVSALVTKEAFIAAQDPSRFPDQLQYVQPWQAKRLVWNNFLPIVLREYDVSSLIRMNTVGYSENVKGTYDLHCNKAQSCHKSQGFGTFRWGEGRPDYFEHVDGIAAKENIFEDVERDWSQVKGGEKIPLLIEKIRESYCKGDKKEAVVQLTKVLSSLNSIQDEVLKNIKRTQVLDLIKTLAGLVIEAETERPFVTKGEEIKISLSVIQHSLQQCSLLEASIGSDSLVATSKELNQGHKELFESGYIILDSKRDDQIYWLVHPTERSRYSLPKNPLHRGLPFAPSPLTIDVRLSIEHFIIDFKIPLVFVWYDPKLGRRLREVEIVPTATVTPKQEVLLSPNCVPVTSAITVRGFKPCEGTLIFSGPEEVEITSSTKTFEILNREDESHVLFSARPKLLEYSVSDISIGAKIEDEISGNALREIRYDHIAQRNYYIPSRVKLISFPIKLPSERRVGYLVGAKDEIPNTLRQLGFSVDELHESDFKSGALSKYRTIILGPRAVNVHAETLFRCQNYLLQYAEGGGVVLMQYSTPTKFFARREFEVPFPFKVTRFRVTDEKSAIRIINPHHVILNEPNQIVASDFNNWVHERGLYFADNWNDQFVPLLGMHDPGEEERLGGLISAKVGKGRFTYTGLSFFRQLPAGVPGAIRLFVNLISNGGG